jgi:hypothetical protein
MLTYFILVLSYLQRRKTGFNYLGTFWTVCNFIKNQVKQVSKGRQHQHLIDEIC